MSDTQIDRISASTSSVTPIAYVEFYVRDCVPALEYLTGPVGFVARGLAEQADRVSVLVESGSARLIVTEPRGDGAVSRWLATHGDGVRDVALYRSDILPLTQRARRSNLPLLLRPRCDPDTGVVLARTPGLGAVRHTLIGDESGSSLPPGFPWQQLRSIATHHASPAIRRVDHIAITLAAGTLAATVDRYRILFDLTAIRGAADRVAAPSRTGCVLREPAGRFAYVLQEADHGSTAVDHVAFLIDDLATARTVDRVLDARVSLSSPDDGRVPIDEVLATSVLRRPQATRVSVSSTASGPRSHECCNEWRTMADNLSMRAGDSHRGRYTG